MAFTSSDLSSVESAILAIASGTKIVEITVAGKTTRYQAAKIEVLLKLRDHIRTELVTAGTGGGWNKIRFDNPT